VREPRGCLYSSGFTELRSPFLAGIGLSTNLKVVEIADLICRDLHVGGQERSVLVRRVRFRMRRIARIVPGSSDIDIKIV
jgi:hypothetical protein